MDDDLGFVFWLGNALDTVAFSALPAKSVPDAALLIMQLDLRVDVLVINQALFGAHDFISALHRTQKDIRVIGIRSDDNKAVNFPGVHTTYTRPTSFNASTKAGWLQCIEQVLAGNALH